MSGPQFPPSSSAKSDSTFQPNPFPPLAADLILFDTARHFASSPPTPMKLEAPFNVAFPDGAEIFTHQLGGNIFGDKQSLRQYQKIMNTIEKEWPALTKLIDAQHPNNRIAIFTVSNCDTLKKVNTGGLWGPFTPREPFLKQFNAAIFVEVNSGKASIPYVGHEWFHEIQSTTHTIKSGKSPHDSPISLTAFLNRADENEVVKSWWKGYDSYRSAKLSPTDPRHIIYGKPAHHYAIFCREIAAGNTAEAAKAWTTLTQEIGSYMVSARLEHGHQAIQEHAYELGQLIDKKLEIVAFTEPCPKKFKTQLLTCTKHVGKALTVLGLGFDVYHEYTQLPDTHPNKKAHALINGSMRNLVGLAISNTGSHAESLLYDTTHMGSSSEAARHIEDTVGKDKLGEIMLKGHRAIARENTEGFLDWSGDDLLIGEERKIYFSYMNACHRNIQESIQEPITKLYDTAKDSVSAFAENFSKGYETFQKSLKSFGDEIQAGLSGVTIWDLLEQQKLSATLVSHVDEIFITPLTVNGQAVDATKEQISASKEPLFRQWMKDFLSNSEATMSISIQGVSEDVLKSEEPLTEEQINTIAKELDSVDKQILPKLKESGQTGKELDKGLTDKCDDKNKGEYFQKFAEGVAKFTAAIYMERQQRLEQKKFETAHEQMEMEFDQRKMRSDALHYQMVTQLSLTSIERNVFNVLHPSGDFRKSLNDMAHFVDVCSQHEKEIRKLIHEHKKIKHGLEKQHTSLDTLDKSIKRKYEAMIDARNKAIKAHSKAQKSLGAMKSLFSIAALVPPLTPYALGAAAATEVVSTGVGIGSTHQDKRRMRTEFKYRNKREQAQNIRDRVAQQTYQQTSTIYHLEQEKIHLRRERSQAMESNIAIDPAKYREQLQEDKKAINEDVEKTQNQLKKKTESAQKLQKEIDSCKEKLDPKAIQQKIEETKKELNAIIKQKSQEAVKSTKGKGTSAKGSKKGKKKKEKKSKSECELLAKISYYTLLLRSDQIETRSKLAEAEAALSETTSECLNLGSHLETLTKEQKENEEKIKREERLANTKDIAYQTIIDELNKYKPSTPEAEEIQEYLDKAFAAYHSIRSLERAAVGGTLGAFEGLFQELSNGPVLRGVLETFTPFLSEKVKGRIGHVPIYLQYVTSLGQQFYRVYDAYLHLRLSHKTLGSLGTEGNKSPPDIFDQVEENFMDIFGWLKSERLQNAFSMLTNNQVMQKFGPLRYALEVIAPAISIATGTLACVRIINQIAHGCPRTLSPEEMKLDKIQEFLTEFKLHLDGKILSLHKDLDKKHQDVIDNINIMRSELGIVASEIVAEIEYARNQILNKQEEINYNAHTVRIKKTGNKISKAFTTLEHSINREEILEFFNKIYVSLKHDSAFDINTGVTLSHGDDVTPLVNIQNAVKNPDMYTGLIAHKTHFPKQLSSLYLFNLIYQNFLSGLALAEPYLKNFDEPLFTLIDDCTSLLEIQGNDLNEFCGKIDAIIRNCRTTQDESLKSLQQQLSSVRIEKEYYIQHKILQERTRCSTMLTNDPNYVGAEKFDFAELFGKTTMSEITKSKTNGVAKEFFTEFGIVATAGTIPLIGFGILFGPLALLIGLPALGVGSLVHATDIAANYHQRENLKKTYDDLTLLSQLKNRQTSIVPYSNRGREGLEVNVWLTEKGKLCGTISRVISDTLYKSDLLSSPESHEASEGKTSFDIRYRLLRDRKILLLRNDGSIKVEEIEKLELEHHLPNKAKYDIALKTLLTSYEQLMQPNSQIKLDYAQFLCSNDLSTVPLAFPKKLLNELESRMNPDRILMEALGIGFLEPSYSFTKDSNSDGYNLRVQYYFIDRAKPTERKLYEEFEVAYVDDNTVKSFAKPSFSIVQKTNDPNLNELLIQLMYTTKELGVPGDKTISLGENRWVVPSMRPFPGFFNLLHYHPDCAIHFNSKNYTEEMSNDLMMYDKSDTELCADGKIKTATSPAPQKAKEQINSMLQRSRSTQTGLDVAIWKRIRESKADLEETKRLLIENYNLLIAYCRLVSSLDAHSLRQKLEKDFGVLDPNNFDAFYDLIIGGINLPTIDDTALASFKMVLKLIPSKYLALINQDNYAIPITKGIAQSPPSSGVDEGSPLENRNDEEYWYSGTDIEIVQTFLFKEEHSVNLLSPMDSEQLAQCSKQIQEMLVEGKPLLFIYNPNGNHYTAVAMIPTGKKQVKILYKDSKGGVDDPTLNIFPQDYTVSLTSHPAKEQVNDVSCGIYALDNLRTMINYLKESSKKETFITTFAQFDGFCSNIKVKDLRKNEFAIAYEEGKKLLEQRAKEDKKTKRLIRARHQKEIDAIAEKIRQAFPSRVVISVTAKDKIKKLEHANTIFVEFALGSDILENKSYDYFYRIYASNDILLNDLKNTVSALGLSEEEYEVDLNVIKISSDRTGKLG